MNQFERLIKDKITIPVYYKKYINHAIDLTSSPKQCCFNHHENTPSFSYSVEKDIWSCFGKCKIFGADVITMCQLHQHLYCRADAVEFLKRELHLIEPKKKINPKDLLKREEIEIDENFLTHSIEYNIACKTAKTIDDYIKLDYIMSQNIDRNSLTNLLIAFNRERGRGGTQDIR